MDKGAFLKEIRVKHKLSRDKIGKILGVSGSVIRDYEINRVVVTSYTKYIQGICALYGYNPEIFDYDEITPELLAKLEFSKFAKSIRKYLYFSGHKIDIGKNTDNIGYVYHILFDILKIKSIGDGLLFLIPELVKRLKNQNIINHPLSNIKLDKNNILLLEMFIIIALKKFRPSEFGNIDEYIDIVEYKDKFIEKWNCGVYIYPSFKEIKVSVTNINPIEVLEKASRSIYIDKMSNKRDECMFLDSSPLALNQIQLKEKLLSMEKNGLELNIDTIKYTYKYIKYKNLENELKQLEKELNITPDEVVPSDNKASEICTLLEYAPEPFKDKLLNKLREYKKDIEEL